MGLTSWSTSNYLARGAAVVSGPPFLFSVWAYRATSGGQHTFACVLGQNGSNLNKQRIGCDDTDHAHLQTTDGAANSEAITSATHANNTWFHMAGALMSSTSRSVWLNGANRIDNTESRTPATPDRTTIGIGTDGASFPWAAAGALAEVSIWDTTGFTSGNLDSIASKLYNGGAGGAGGNPLNITAESSQPWTNKLVAYWTLVNTTTGIEDAFAGNDMTMTGTLTVFGSHPNIEAVSGGATNLMPQIWM